MQRVSRSVFGVLEERLSEPNIHRIVKEPSPDLESVRRVENGRILYHM
jgi:hypothetical protein